ncbi:protein gone early isoform X2 [Cylas formicarius]|uniref:protein gone early isoform X2 n=1 Tax=Cylas formicarius TaxID=197179 RepID=UPI0029586341|nr:protein gone early isoform X2 [Cylas formicarius]XP_060534597.1 protein gone early isoform X2 [Cylas formicarius]
MRLNYSFLQLSENLNRSVSPCGDLWGAVCGGWLENHSRPADRSVWNQKQQLVKKELERVRDLISTLPVPLHTGTVEWNLKRLYEACLDVDTLNQVEDRPLKTIITELGGWYVLRDWNDQDFDGMSVLAKLQVHYGTSPYFKIHVEPNPLDPGASSIRISPSGLGLPDRDYYYRDTDDRIQAAYKEYIRDVIIYLSSTTNEASKFGQDMYSYERRIAEITPSLVTLQNPVVTYNAISISELKATNLIPFYDILQAMYPNANISENTEVLVTSLEYLNQVAQIIASTDRRTMNGYLIWTLVRKYAPYLSESYTSAVDIFHSKLLGVSKARKRWEICSQLVRDHMGLATEYYFEKNRPISAETYDVVNDTFNVILDVVKERIRQFDGTDLLYQQLKSKLDTLHLQIGLPDSARAALFLKDYYAPLKIIKGYLFESVKNSVEFQKKVEQKMLLKQLLESTVLEPLFREVPQVTYSAPNNLIIVPRSLVSDPYFEAGFPKPVVYGRLGVELAESVVSSVLPYGSSWTSEKKILSPFHMTVNESFKAALPAVNCLAEFVSDLNLDVSVDRANETGLTLLKKLSAVSVAYEALLKKTQTLSHIHQPGLEEFEDAALFFLSYGQSQCSNSTSQHQLYDNMIHFNLPQNSVLHLAWAQLPYFPESFQCLPNKKLRCPGIF